MIKHHIPGTKGAVEYKAEIKSTAAPKVRIRYTEDGLDLLKTECGKIYVAATFDKFFTPIKLKIKTRKEAARDANPDKKRVI